MLNVDEARSALCQQAIAIERCERVNLSESAGRFAAIDHFSTIDNPPQDNSAMDGVALNTDDLQTTSTLPLSQHIPAGIAPGVLTPGSAARIFTGANIPLGANCVVIQENCLFNNNSVTVNDGTQFSRGDNIRPKGQDFQRNEIILSKGQRIQASHIGLAAAAGISHVDVVNKPRVALISTGSELIPLEQTLSPGKIYNSNSHMLSQLLKQWGCEITVNTVVEDNLDTTVKLLDELSSTADVIITCGGVSVGDEDHVKNAISKLGQIELWKIAMKPGKPLAFGTLGKQNTPIIALPGNPVSSFVSSVLFVRPFISALCGADYAPLDPHFAKADFTIESPRKRVEFARGNYAQGYIRLHANQSSGAISSVARSNALVLIDKQITLSKGQIVPYFPLNDFY